MGIRELTAAISVLVMGNLLGCQQISDRRADVVDPTSRSVAAASPADTGTAVDSSQTAEDCGVSGQFDPACFELDADRDWVPVIREFRGVEMVLVPPGCFQMGTENSLAEEQPVHQICFDEPYWIDRTEVTVAQFAEFLNDQPEPVDRYDTWLHVWGINGNVHIQLKLEGQTWHPVYNLERQPLENVTWIGAADFCAWREARLPTEAEWEYAARGPESTLYPWGNEFISDNIVRFTGSNPDVGSKPQGASWVGALDMSGSVFEWTSSLYFPYPYDAEDGREAAFEEDSDSHRVFRGCAWYHDFKMNDNLTAAGRFDAPPDFANWYYGFRCARSADG